MYGGRTAMSNPALLHGLKTGEPCRVMAKPTLLNTIVTSKSLDQVATPIPDKYQINISRQYVLWTH